MPLRPIKKKSAPFLKGIALPDCHALHMENVYHTPGQAAAIRFFDHRSKIDFRAIRETISGKHVRKWMDDASTLTKSDYEDWAGSHTNSQFLFAVLDARGTDPKELEQIRGFIYLYSERGEKFRVKRMEKLGFLKPAKGTRHALEVSFALRPPKPGAHSGSGLISSALRQSCLQVKFLLDSPVRPDIRIFAYVDRENSAARRTLEAAGFIHRGMMKYDRDSAEATCLYFLSWRRLNQKIREKLLEFQQH